ncbi:hypothetical protein JXA12_05685 [Candidatus Woesearchaeota archaeon]|nr:hypothetical protein [Candidatus Woesearchaeota archaeon]
MNEDISKNTLLILVVLTIIVSLLGTWTVINEAGKVRADAAPAVVGEASTTGKVAIDVAAPPEPVSSTGRVVLNIEKV